MADADLMARLAKMEMRQEALIGAVSRLFDSLEVVRDQLSELLAWANQPPSSDLPEALAQLAAGFDTLRADIQRLPDRVARAVETKCP